jgi:hypothetical protein
VQGSVVTLSNNERALPGDGDVDNHTQEGVSGVVVGLKNEEMGYRRFTDREGRFVFTDLRPGHYRLQVNEGQIHEFQKLAIGEYEFDLTPGQILGNLDFFIVPVEREIIITTQEEN